MNGVIDHESDHSEFVEVDPTGRYGRYNEILGKGASKTVYKAFDEYEGIEVAWNQVKLYDFLQSPEDLERLYCEIHLLKTLKHRNIMKFYTSWVDTTKRNINFVTEMFTSGTLRQYRLKHKRVNIRAVKHWCRQILKGLLYLHSHDPPVIHRDLKCDNIFINGNQGEVKIGDLGLASILHKSHAVCCVGTPEFMAPEVYAEEYNELVDIYSFGMCILEMVTFEYPYSECTSPAQIYKKVISGRKPEALFKVKDPEVCRFVEKCLATVSQRRSARELLNDPFLQIDDCVPDLHSQDYYENFDETGPFLRQVQFKFHHNTRSRVKVHDSNNFICDASDYFTYEHQNEFAYNTFEYDTSEIDIFGSREDEQLENVDITIKGRRKEDDGIFLRLRIADKEGRFRNIYFPFDIKSDTASSVAMEMVTELDLTDQDVNKIADMIDGEISSIVPEWKRGIGMEESPCHTTSNCCQNCASSGSLVNYLSSDHPDAKGLQVIQCSRHGCGYVHGRFEEITYLFDGSEQCLTEGAPVDSSQSDDIHYTDIWAQHDRRKYSTHSSTNNHFDEHEPFENPPFNCNDRILNLDEERKPCAGDSSPVSSSVACSPADNYENEIRRELRWLKAKYQMQLSELKSQQIGIASKPSRLTCDNEEHKKDKLSSVSTPTKEELLKSFGSGKHFTTYFPVDATKNGATQDVTNCDTAYGACSPDHMVTAKSFYTGSLLPQSLHRATSLPVDAIDL